MGNGSTVIGKYPNNTLAAVYEVCAAKNLIESNSCSVIKCMDDKSFSFLKVSNTLPKKTIQDEIEYYQFIYSILGITQNKNCKLFNSVEYVKDTIHCIHNRNFVYDNKGNKDILNDAVLENYKNFAYIMVLLYSKYGVDKINKNAVLIKNQNVFEIQMDEIHVGKYTIYTDEKQIKLSQAVNIDKRTPEEIEMLAKVYDTLYDIVQSVGKDNVKKMMDVLKTYTRDAESILKYFIRIS